MSASAGHVIATSSICDQQIYRVFPYVFLPTAVDITVSHDELAKGGWRVE
jgi:hypothetical protein